MRNILTEFRYSPSHVSTLFINNKSGIEISKNPEYHGYMKHLDLWYYWLKDAVQDSLITSVYVPSCQNVVDLFTEAIQLQVCSSQTWLNTLGIHSYLLYYSFLSLSIGYGLIRSREYIRSDLLSFIIVDVNLDSE